MSSTLVARPVATSSSSAAISAASPPSGPTVSATPRRRATTDAASKRALVMTLMPRRVKLRSSSWLTSRSSSGTTAGRYSSSVTSAPRSWYIEANSTPTAPAPITMMLVGSVSVRRTSSEVTIRLPSGTSPGSDFTREPGGQDDVRRAQQALAAGTRRAVLAGQPDADLVAPSSRPRPWIQVTLFFLTRLWTPFHMRLTTWSRRRRSGRSRPRPRPAARGRSPRRGGSARRRPRTRAAPWWGCSRGGGRCRRSCPRRRGRP